MIGKVLSCDRNGDVLLQLQNATREDIKLGDAVDIDNNSLHLRNIPVYDGYYCKKGDAVLLWRGEEFRLSVKDGKFNDLYQVDTSAELIITLRTPKLYWEQQNAYSFETFFNRSHYRTIEEFANFRPLFLNGKNFFRGSSPFDDTYCRAEASATCVLKNKVTTIINLADTKEEFDALLDNGLPASLNVASKCHVVTLGNDSGVYTVDFGRNIAIAIEAIITSPGPFFIHCKAGKRRSGFLCAILQQFAGCNRGYIVEQYMLSYVNNNGIDRLSNQKQYDYIANDTIIRILDHIGPPSNTEKYLKIIGVNNQSVGALKDLLKKAP